MLDNYWWSSGAAGGGDQGDPIGESLRLRGQTNCWLTRTFSNNGNQQVFTISGWMKPSLNPVAVNQGGPMIQLLGTGSGGGNQDNYAFFQTTAAFFSNTAANTSLFNANVGRAFRDPSAWYHVVVSVNTPAANAADRLRVWINGDLQTFSAGAIMPAQNANSPTNSGAREHFIGCFNNPGGPIPSTGYIADYFFLDGTVADETNFGRFNGDGVWVPDPDEFTAAQYGANGYHLTFANPDNIGADTAPTGGTGHTAANNWTVGNGLNTNRPGLFSNNCFTGSNRSTGFDFTARENNFAAGVNGVTAGFDGNNGTFAFAQQNQSVNFVFDFAGVTEIMVRTDTTVGYEFALNENPITVTRTVVGPAAEQVFNLPADFDGNVSMISIRGSGTTMTPGFSGIFLNGRATPLADNTGKDYDVMQDSPTQNYATGNPLHMPTASQEFVPTFASLGNNQSSGGVFGGLQPTMPWDATQQWYFEVKVSSYPFNTWFGFNGNPGPNAQTGTTGTTSSNGVINWAMNGGSALGTMGTSNGPFTDITWTPNYTVQANVVAGWEWDGPNRRIRYYENGVLRSTSSQWAAGSFDTANFFFGYNNSTDPNWTYNFGQQPFTNRPAGFTDENNLQTQNLPEAPIRNGRDHFGVLTYEGDNTAGRNVTGLSFTPGLVWVKNRDLSRDHVVSDNRMNSGRKVIPNTPNGNGAMTASDDFVRGFVDGGFTVGNNDQVNGDNTNDYVAWCWRSADANTNVTETDAIPSSCRINTAAGFSIIQFTGNTDTDRVGHGLDREPEFVISKCLGVGSTAWQIYHHDLGVGSFLPFTTSAMSNIANFWGTAANWNNNTCGLSTTGSDNNRNNELMRWYAWHGVEGFSRFGSFTGNGQANGSFVHLGFKPALLVIRAAQTGTNGEEPWMVYDSAREPNNPVNEALEWNSRNAEGATARDVDLLSNGFKLRSAGNQVNGNTTNYIYAAWAEMPAGASNTSPATAR